MTTVAIQVPAYQEAHTLPKTLRAINEQSTPDGYELHKEAWVTRSEDRRGVCSTWQAAKMVEGWEPREAPSGKLAARNAAHDDALSREVDVILAWDADAPPLGEGVLAALLEPLGDGVVCTNSTPVSDTSGSLLDRVIDTGASVEDLIFPHVHGQCHALTAEAWRQIGPFDETVDQTDLAEVRGEEEFGFYRRLRKIGRVVDVPEARVYNDPRRHRCRLPGYNDGYCDERGVTTFMPRER